MIPTFNRHLFKFKNTLNIAKSKIIMAKKFLVKYFSKMNISYFVLVIV